MSVDTFFSEGPLTVAEILDSIRTQSLDESNRSPVFSDKQIKLAMRQAILNSRGKFFLSDTTDIEYTAGELGPYTLPRSVQRITLVTREKIEGPIGLLSGVSAGEVLHHYRHLRNLEENVLYLTRDYLSSTLTIWYERDVQIPIDDRTVAGDHDNDDTTLVLNDDQPLLWQVELPAYFRWDDEIIKMTATSGNASATISRGALGTTAAAHSDGSSISQLVVADIPQFYSFLSSEIGRLLNLWRVQAGNKNTNVAANITATRFFDTDRERSLQQIPQTKKTRKMTFTQRRRPRRGGIS